MRGGISLAEEGSREAGRRIGNNYRVIRELGHGGDGTIYLVQHEPTEQLRAAKLLKTDVPGRRRHELDMMKRLKHPALPQVYDVLEEQGEFWIIIEYIKGKTLSELCAEGKIGTARFFSIARQLADVLVYLHTRKPPVLHLDIKPSNIMVRPDGALVLIDFGAAVRADTRSGMSACFGTPGFAAPEQWNPRAEPDVRADIYGFGAVLYYCLNGAAPGNEVRMHRRNLAVPLIRRCLQEDRERRFPDTLSLYHSVRKAEKRYGAWKKAGRSSLAILFLLVTMAFAAVNLQWSEQSEVMAAQTKRSYDLLLEQADGLGFEQAVSCYEQAIRLYPEDSAWCDRLLDRIESDYTFSLKEETALKNLMFSVPSEGAGTEEELLAEKTSDYGSFAYRIGIMYWYFYEGTGGKSAAAKWFERAAAWQEELDDSVAWLESARIHAKIGGYYGTLGKQNPDGDGTVEIRTYWEDLVRLWKLDSMKDEPLRVQCEVAQELLSVLIMQSAELKKEGVGAKKLQDVLLKIELFLSDHPESEQVMEACWEQYQAAWEALERLTENERRNGIGTKKKEQG